MDITVVKKMNNLTKKIEKVYNEMIRLKNDYDRKNKMLIELQKELNNLTSQGGKND